MEPDHEKKQLKLIGYVRVSSDASANRRADGLNYGNSELDQSERIRAYCLQHGHELIAIMVDSGISGGTLYKRPALRQALASLRNNQADGLVCLQLDRLARSAADWHRMISFHFLPVSEGGIGKTLMLVKEGLDTTTTFGRCMLNMMLALAEMFRVVSVERGREMSAYHSRHGRTPSGRIMYGWQTPYGQPFTTSGLKINEAQYEAIKMVLMYRFDWKLSIERCAWAMTAYTRKHPESAFRYSRHDKPGETAMTWTPDKVTRVIAQWQKWGMPGDDVIPERNRRQSQKSTRQMREAEEEVAEIVRDVRRINEEMTGSG